MTWSFLAVGAAGVLIGVRFRVPTMLAMCFATMVASVTTMKLLGFSDRQMVFTTFLLVLTLQGGYVFGLLIVSLLHRSIFHRRLR